MRRLANGAIGMAFQLSRRAQGHLRDGFQFADEGREPGPSRCSFPTIRSLHDRLQQAAHRAWLRPLARAAALLRRLGETSPARQDRLVRRPRPRLADDEGETRAALRPLARRCRRATKPKIGSIRRRGARIAERADGSLLMTMRTPMGAPTFLPSRPTAAKPGRPRSLKLTSPLAPACLTRIPGTSKLLMVWTPNYESAKAMMGKRNTIMAGVSDDGGRTWPRAETKETVSANPTKSTDYPGILPRKRSRSSLQSAAAGGAARAGPARAGACRSRRLKSEHAVPFSRIPRRAAREPRRCFAPHRTRVRRRSAHPALLPRSGVSLGAVGASCCG